ncbi:hypothetical protein DENSPDRAFT_601177 [Dentipellis sp. KUC8613]|nr:hypothetical protein DENSPDRAFT_601177 [Dentipellis sp. KUC8613]
MRKFCLKLQVTWHRDPGSIGTSFCSFVVNAHVAFEVQTHVLTCSVAGRWSRITPVGYSIFMEYCQLLPRARGLHQKHPKSESVLPMGTWSAHASTSPSYEPNTAEYCPPPGTGTSSVLGRNGAIVGRSPQWERVHAVLLDEISWLASISRQKSAHQQFDITAKDPQPRDRIRRRVSHEDAENVVNSKYTYTSICPGCRGRYYRAITVQDQARRPRSPAHYPRHRMNSCVS